MTLTIGGTQQRFGFTPAEIVFMALGAALAKRSRQVPWRTAREHAVLASLELATPQLHTKRLLSKAVIGAASQLVRNIR